MDNPLTPEKQNILIEDALRTYPAASMPRDITADVLKRIQSAPRPFRFMRRDAVLGLAVLLCLGVVWFSLPYLPPIVIAQIRKESILFSQHLLVNVRWLIPAVSFSLAGFLSALTIPYFRQEWRKTPLR